MSEDSVIVGTFTIIEPLSHRYSISETASRYEEVLLEPGVYEVHAHRGYQQRNEVRLLVDIPGTVTSRYDGSEYGGVAIGSSPQHGNHPDVGKVREVSMTVLPDKVVWNDTALEALCWQWGSYLKHRDERVAVETYRSLRWADTLFRQTYRIVPPADLSHYVDSPHMLAHVVNGLLDADIRPDLYRTYGHKEDGSAGRWFPEDVIEHQSFPAYT